MTLGMRGNAMQGRNPNMAMKASNFVVAWVNFRCFNNL